MPTVRGANGSPGPVGSGFARCGGGRELLLLLLQELSNEAGTLDRELLHLLVGCTCEGVQELRHLLDLTRLEEGFEVVVRQADVAAHLPFVGLEELDHALEIPLLAVEGREAEERQGI